MNLSSEVVDFCVMPYLDWRQRLDYGSEIQREMLNLYAHKIQKTWRNYSIIKHGADKIHEWDTISRTQTHENGLWNSYEEWLDEIDTDSLFEKLAMWYGYCYEKKYVFGYETFLTNKLENLGMKTTHQAESMREIMEKIPFKKRLHIFMYLMLCRKEVNLSIRDLLNVGI